MVAAVTESTAPFNDDEKDAILRLLGYPNFTQLAPSFKLGFPGVTQPAFLVFRSFDMVSPSTRARVRRDVCRALETEEQIHGSRVRRQSSKVAEVELNAHELSDLYDLLQFWTQRIADGLGVIANPYSTMEYRGMPGGGFNAKVS